MFWYYLEFYHVGDQKEKLIFKQMTLSNYIYNYNLFTDLLWPEDSQGTYGV